MPAPEPTHDDARTLAELAAQLRALGARVEALHERVTEDGLALREDAEALLEALEHVYDDDRDSRRRLRELRLEPSYEAAFVDPAPLVSVVIPTWQSVDTLVERALPSALGQSHPNIEVVVVGDHAPPATAEAIARLGDARVRYENLTVRGPYAEQARGSWLAAGTPGFNAGLALARGQWIAPLGDDDAFDRGHVARLLDAARRHRHELVYGQIRQLAPDGSESILGGFPPQLGAINLQATLYHGGLRFLELEFGHAAFGTPNDWGLIRRMLRAGVRVGMVEEVSVTYWPSPSGFETQQPREPLESVRARRAAETDGRLAAEQRIADLEAQATELARRLDEVRRSRSWRLTAPLRRLRPRS